MNSIINLTRITAGNCIFEAAPVPSDFKGTILIETNKVKKITLFNKTRQIKLPFSSIEQDKSHLQKQIWKLLILIKTAALICLVLGYT